MNSIKGRWERYERWNNAIADTIYSASAAGQPAYLDLEDDIITAVGRLAEPEATSPQDALIDAVRGTLVLDHRASDVWRGHLRRLDDWWRNEDTLDPPPTVALAALFSLAAEAMQDTAGKAANNFYGQLKDLLRLDEQELAKVTAAYRKVHPFAAAPVSEYLWTSINEWLVHLEGNRGLPTAAANAEGHAHIGFPLSQALVRATDRQKFGEMFALFGLAPGSSMTHVEMAELIDEWMARTPCPATNNLERIWRHDRGARERITQVARVCLENWDGVSDGPTGELARPRDLLKLRLQVQTFPRRRAELNLLLPARADGGVETVDVLDEGEEVTAQLAVEGAAPGWLALADSGSVDFASVLGGVVRLRRDERLGLLQRRPRRLIPLRFDSMVQGFVESERLQLGEQSALLVRSEIAPVVEQLLGKVARPGFEVESELAGIPAGWMTFLDVQVLSSIPPEELKNRLADLNVLQPLASTQSGLHGGLSLPGNIQKWFTARPPELRVSTDTGDGLEATLTATRSPSDSVPVPLVRRTDQSVLIWDLLPERLPDGDYVISTRSKGSQSEVSNHVLRLRSADSPARPSEDRGHPVHDPSSASFGIGAANVDGQVEGTFSLAPNGTSGLPLVELPESPPRWPAARSRETAVDAPGVSLVRFPKAPDSSCMSTGAHHMMLEPGDSRQQTTEGICRHCGLVKRYPSTFRRAQRRKKSAPQLAPTIDVANLAPVRAHESFDWGTAFDATCHVGSGPISALQRIARSFDPGAVFFDSLVRELEVLGHIEVVRNPHTLVPEWWAVNPPTLVELPNGASVLTGFRSEQLVAALKAAAATASIDVEERGGSAEPVAIVLSAAPAQNRKNILDALAEASPQPPQWISRGSHGLAAALPELSSVRARLPVTRAVAATSIERWQPDVARFKSVPDSSQPGAYRLSSFGRAYIFRTPEQIERLEAYVGNARLVKHLSALSSGESLVGYDAAARSLYVPIGADLPGIFGRTACLASGLAPQRDEQKQLLVYRDVPTDIAAQVIMKLST